MKTIHDLGFVIGEKYHIHTGTPTFDDISFTPVSDESKSIVLSREMRDRTDFGSGTLLKFRVFGSDMLFNLRYVDGHPHSYELVRIMDHPLELCVGELYDIDWTHLGTAVVRCSVFFEDCPEMAARYRDQGKLSLAYYSKRYSFRYDLKETKWRLISVYSR